jgi:zinc protease
MMLSARAYRFALSVFALACVAIAVPAQSPKTGTAFHVAEQHYKLANGLKVVLSPDATVPTAVIAVYYNIGFRNEPRDRTGFAHLFEHLMFQGSQNLGKLQFIRLVEENGGILNGSTRFDFTNYFQVVPSNAVRRILWAEADRMKGLAIDTANVSNQRDVVKNEVRVNVLNQPYGGFSWSDLPIHANTNWYNAHNFYGDMGDLDAANLADAPRRNRHAARGSGPAGTRRRLPERLRQTSAGRDAERRAAYDGAVPEAERDDAGRGG